MRYGAFSNAWRNPHRLYRDPGRGLVAGVCAGIAGYFGVDPGVIRAAAIVGLIFFFPLTVALYVIAALVLKEKPAALYRTPEEEEFWRNVATAPDRTLRELRRKFRELEERLARLESQATSEEFELRRKFRNIGG